MSSAATQQVCFELLAARADVPTAVPCSVAEFATWLGFTFVMSIDSMTPTRVPPIRTSLFFTRRAAFGTITEARYVGTNGNPLFAL